MGDEASHTANPYGFNDARLQFGHSKFTFEKNDSALELSY
ncbi:hypothetical protein ACPOL_6654 [Acidisarcina polymorpha]|uniref:Uncharacterized protein n=1 Tax=Acidisarcina polymorpha TaxID=2211140 RepID=A0A2Z5GB53_9BACT|nr:hypothetical protein ACPOL_6654 [Acidisarcina polymorpha]